MKRYISILLFGLMFVMMSFSVNAAEKDDMEASGKVISDEKVKEYALDFMTVSQENENLQISSFVRLYDQNGNVTGYYITFCDHDKERGYLLLSLISGPDPVVELAFEGRGPLYNTLEEASMVSYNEVFEEKNESESKIIYNGAGRMYVPLYDDQYYSVYDQMNTAITEQEIKSRSANVNIYEGIIDWSNANINYSKLFKIENFSDGKNYWLMTDFASGGVCSPTALTNILWFWGKDCGRSSVMNKVSSYGTNIQKAKAIFAKLNANMDGGRMHALEKFFGVAPKTGGVWNYKFISDGSNFETFTTALKDGCPVYVSVHTTKGASGTGDVGHGVFALGYTYSNVGAKYLVVMDGWNRNGRIVKFDYYPYVAGWKIWVA